MSKFVLVVTCSLKAYESIIEATNNSHHKLPYKTFTINDKGYVYFDFDNEQLDTMIIEDITFLNDQVRKLNDMGEFASINQIDN